MTIDSFFSFNPTLQFLNGLNIWKEYWSFGYPWADFNVISLNLLIAVLSHFLGLIVAQKIIFFVFTLSSAVSINLLLKYFLDRDSYYSVFVRIFISIYYVFNPFTISFVWWRSMLIQVLWILTPLLALVLLRLVDKVFQNKSIDKEVLVGILLLLLFSSALTPVFIIPLVFLTFVIFTLKIFRQEQGHILFLKKLPIFLITALVWGAVSCWWLLPAVYSVPNSISQAEVYAASSVSSLDDFIISSKYTNLLNVFRGYGYFLLHETFNGSTFYDWNQQYLKSVILSSANLLPIFIIVLGLFFVKKTKDQKTYLILSVAFILVLFIIKGYNQPFEYFNLFLVNLPLGSALRHSLDKFAVLYYLFVCLLIMSTFESIRVAKKRILLGTVSVLFVISVILLTYPVYTDKVIFSGQGVLRSNRVLLPDDYEALKLSRNYSGNAIIFPLPIYGGTSYSWSNGAHLGNYLLFHELLSTVNEIRFINGNKYSDFILELIYEYLHNDYQSKNLAGLFDFFNINYIFLQKDWDGRSNLTQEPNIEYYITMLTSFEKQTLGSLEVYNTKLKSNTPRNPQLYITNNVIEIPFEKEGDINRSRTLFGVMLDIYSQLDESVVFKSSYDKLNNLALKDLIFWNGNYLLGQQPDGVGGYNLLIRNKKYQKNITVSYRIDRKEDYFEVNLFLEHKSGLFKKFQYGPIVFNQSEKLVLGLGDDLREVNLDTEDRISEIGLYSLEELQASLTYYTLGDSFHKNSFDSTFDKKVYNCGSIAGVEEDISAKLSSLNGNKYVTINSSGHKACIYEEFAVPVNTEYYYLSFEYKNNFGKEAEFCLYDDILHECVVQGVLDDEGVWKKYQTFLLKNNDKLVLHFYTSGSIFNASENSFDNIDLRSLHRKKVVDLTNLITYYDSWQNLDSGIDDDLLSILAEFNNSRLNNKDISIYNFGKAVDCSPGSSGKADLGSFYSVDDYENAYLNLWSKNHKACVFYDLSDYLNPSVEKYHVYFRYKNISGGRPSFCLWSEVLRKCILDETLTSGVGGWAEYSNSFILKNKEFLGGLVLHFYSESSTEEVSSNSFSSLKITEDLGASFEALGIPKDLTVTNVKIIDSVQVNNSKYSTQLSNARSPFALVLSESFDTGWRLRIENSTKSHYLTEQRHFVANGFANGWWIDPSEFPEDIRNEDGEYEIVLEFWPQRYFYLGLLISGTTLLGCLVYLGYDVVRRRREKGGKAKSL